MKDLKFEPILNVTQDLRLNAHSFYKCSVDSALGLLGFNCRSSGGNYFVCVDMATKNIVYKERAFGYHTHHWIMHKPPKTKAEESTTHTFWDDQPLFPRGLKYLSLQTERTLIKMFLLDEAKRTFREEEAFRIRADGSINYSEFDRNFENILILKNYQVLELRCIDDAETVMMRIELNEKVLDDEAKQLVLSVDGTMCAIGGGEDKPHFYVVDLESKQQHNLTSTALTDSCSPCFINGDAELVAVGGAEGQGVEIWDVVQKCSLKVLHIEGGFIGSLTSTNNILAVGTSEGSLQLWDVRNWDMFYSSEFVGLDTRSLHLTSDSKYLTIGGPSGDKCVVMKIS